MPPVLSQAEATELPGIRSRSWVRSTPAAPTRWAHARPVSDRDQVRRALNIGVALLGILITAPIMLAVALLVKLSSPGPVIYSQPRVGVDRRRGSRSGSVADRREKDRGGRVFTIYKFRTMRTEPARSQVWASKSDPRITPIGAFLRASRLDELPQLFNVLLGDMNVVGPRPEQPAIFEELADKVVQYRARQQVLPGITGWAQINSGYDESIDDVKTKVAYDLDYIERRSAWKDLWIMLRTVPVMVFQKVWM